MLVERRTAPAHIAAWHAAPRPGRAPVLGSTIGTASEIDATGSVNPAWPGFDCPERQPRPSAAPSEGRSARAGASLPLAAAPGSH